jgi:hypothetical protein
MTTRELVLYLRRLLARFGPQMPIAELVRQRRTG